MDTDPISCARSQMESFRVFLNPTLYISNSFCTLQAGVSGDASYQLDKRCENVPWLIELTALMDDFVVDKWT
ncbi:hypothetical protein TNCV_1220261 [Trichonephila clavipes]|nr:hypothetical protein TNCV_1220261 [Trichonephila clavipes]